MTDGRKHDFEDQPLPRVGDLPRALCDSETERARIVRAAVVDPTWSEQVVTACEELVTADDPMNISVGLAVCSALSARRAVPAVAAALRRRKEMWATTPNSLDSSLSLAGSALHFLNGAALPGDARVNDVFSWALTVDALCRLAWRRLGQRAPREVIPHLPTLLANAPDLADEVGTVFALIHGDLVVEAARAIAGIDPAVRDVTAAAMEKHLYRIKAIKRWVACRAALAGRS